MRRQTSTARRPVLAIALLALSTQVASVGHLLLVRHTMCPEHGELVESAASGGPAARAAAVARRSASSAIRADAVALEEHGHVHCALAANRRAAHTPAALASVKMPPSPAPAAPACALARPLLQAIYVLAPKASPPV